MTPNDTQYHQSRPETIRSLFAGVAARYDVTNSVTSLGLHNLWNRALVEALLQPPFEGAYLDLCSGTGAIALSFLRRCRRPHEAILLDFCPEMLAIARRRARQQRLEERHRLSFVEGDAQQLALADASVSRVTIAYGIRNVCRPERCLAEVLRVLTPGGRVGILELTRPPNRILRLGHTLYLRTLLPLLGKLCTSQKDAYEYLCDSIERFVEPQQLAQQMTALGFADVAVTPLTGGIAHIISGAKRA